MPPQTSPVNIDASFSSGLPNLTFHTYYLLSSVPHRITHSHLLLLFLPYLSFQPTQPTQPTQPAQPTYPYLLLPTKPSLSILFSTSHSQYIHHLSICPSTYLIPSEPQAIFSRHLYSYLPPPPPSSLFRSLALSFSYSLTLSLSHFSSLPISLFPPPPPPSSSLFLPLPSFPLQTPLYFFAYVLPPPIPPFLSTQPYLDATTRSSI
ncbi:hypothetical protein GGS21DRAFT_457086 [Xylaria nigripes]|nr:hypothetical protein GGS21DRAFT_457086 [Xylaria nigripes]